MPNICKTTIEFIGNKEQITLLESKLVKEDEYYRRNEKTFSYSFIEDKVPPVRDEQIYLLCGIDYNKYILDMLSDEEKKQAKLKVNKYLSEHNYIGLRDIYINERIFEFDYHRKDNKLIFNIELAWHFPTNYVLHVAKQTGTKVSVAERIEGNYTFLCFYDEEKNDYVEYENTIENLLYKKGFYEASKKFLGCDESYLFMAAVHMNDEEKINEILNTYPNLQISNIQEKNDDMIKFDHDLYREEPLTEICRDDNKLELLNSILEKSKVYLDKQKLDNYVNITTTKNKMKI